MPNHYFIGIKLPEPAAETLHSTRRSWNLKSHKKYTLPADMHITLLFIGEIPNGDIEKVAESLAAVHHAPFDLKTSGVRTFGNPATPRIVYAAVKENTMLDQLHSKIKQAVQPFNINLDDRPFTPHITLAAKWAGGAPMDTDTVLALESIEFRVSEFALFEIRPTSSPKYVPLAVYPLESSGEKRNSEHL